MGMDYNSINEGFNNLNNQIISLPPFEEYLKISGLPEEEAAKSYMQILANNREILEKITSLLEENLDSEVE